MVSQQKELVINKNKVDLKEWQNKVLLKPLQIHYLVKMMSIYSKSKKKKKKRNIPIYFNTNYHTEMKLVPIIIMD